MTSSKIDDGVKITEDTFRSFGGERVGRALPSIIERELEWLGYELLPSVRAIKKGKEEKKA